MEFFKALLDFFAVAAQHATTVATQVLISDESIEVVRGRELCLPQWFALYNSLISTSEVARAMHIIALFAGPKSGEAWLAT